MLQTLRLAQHCAAVGNKLNGFCRSNDLTAGVRASAQLLSDTHQGVKSGGELVGATIAHTVLPAVKRRVLAEQGGLLTCSVQLYHVLTQGLAIK